MTRTTDFHEWFTDQKSRFPYHVKRCPLDQLEGWYVDERTGDIRHRSGRFFTVEGVEI
ncbi:NDP-hexose 2,3-dehydratase family protein, partial [Saccharopolyspora taberi]